MARLRFVDVKREIMAKAADVSNVDYYPMQKVVARDPRRIKPMKEIGCKARSTFSCWPNYEYEYS